MNLEKYDKVFIDTFGVMDTTFLKDYEYRLSPGWDSVGHMMLCAGLEDAFGIRLEGEDILSITNYENG